MKDLCQSFDNAGFFGDLQAQEKVTALGTKRESLLTLRIPELSTGVATKVSLK